MTLFDHLEVAAWRCVLRNEVAHALGVGAERGQIRGVAFGGISAAGEEQRIELTGFDEGHVVEDVTFKDVTLKGKPLAPADVKSDPFVRSVKVQP